MTKQEADFIGSMNMCDEISNEAYKKIMCNCKVEEEECEDIEDLPSVKPTRPHGEWIHFTDDFKDYVACSCCGYGEEGEVLLEDKTPFCPVCGADMKEGETDAG